MPDIIDNRKTKLAERISHYLQLSRRAHFAVGYFYVGGFEAIAEAVPGLEKLRLLIGPATDRATAEQITRGVKASDAIGRRWRQETSVPEVDREEMAHLTAEDARETMALMEQTDDNQQLVRDLSQLIEDGIIEVRVYTREPLHAKCYIFDERDPERAEADPGHVIVGSSNLTVSGITSNTELNVVLHDPDSHCEVSAWFEELWQDAEEFAPELLREVESSWAVNDQVTPWEIYIKSLYNLFQEQLAAEAEPIEVIDRRWPELAEFQKDAYSYAKSIIGRFGGVLVADVVGLGKSYIGAALLKWGRLQDWSPMVICPAGLVDMWEAYSDQFDIGATVVSMGLLTTEQDEDGRVVSVLDLDRYRDRNLVLIDESHNLRYSYTQRYQAVEAYLSRGNRRVIMLTATPMAISATDIKNQLRLWPGNGQDLPTGRWTFDEFFTAERDGEAHLPEMLRHVMVRRSRNYVAQTYGEWRRPDGTVFDADDHDDPWEHGRPIIAIGDEEYTFPRRDLQDPVEYRIDDTYRGLYGIIRRIIDPRYDDGEEPSLDEVLDRVDDGRRSVGDPELTTHERTVLSQCIEQRLTYARYGLHDYVTDAYRDEAPYDDLATAGRNLRGLMRTLLFKRLESSIEAFRRTCQTLAQTHKRFVLAMDEGRIPAGEEMQRAIYDVGVEEVSPVEVLDAIDEAEVKSAHRYDIAAFDADELRADLEADGLLFEALYHMVCDIGPDDDAKLTRLDELLYEDIPGDEKILVFTQFEDTARYIYEHLEDNPDVEWVTGSRETATIIARFAPRSNPGLASRAAGRRDIRILVSTDVLSEGLNLQDAHCVVNYDLHFNPVRLIQRMGRIDRLTQFSQEDPGAAPETVWAWNFFPDTSLDQHLDLEGKVRRRIQEMRRVIGVGGAVLHPSEELDEEGVMDLYTGKRRAVERDETQELMSGVLRAEQTIRRLQRERPEELQRIAELPDGVRSARTARDRRGFFVHCRAGIYQQLYVTDENGEIETTGLEEALAAMECDEDEPRGELPDNVNQVMRAVKAHFDQAAAEVQARKDTKARHSIGQRYALSHLREQRMMADTDDERRLIDQLLSAYRQSLPQVLRRRLNQLRSEEVEGAALRDELTRIANDHQLITLRRSQEDVQTEEAIPRIVCGESLGTDETQ